MIALATLILKDGTREDFEIEVRGSVTPRFFDKLDTAIDKKYGKRDDWERWEFRDVKR